MPAHPQSLVNTKRGKKPKQTCSTIPTSHTSFSVAALNWEAHYYTTLLLLLLILLLLLQFILRTLEGARSEGPLMGSHSGRVHNRVSSAPRKLRHLQGKHASRIGFPPSPHATTQPQSRVHTKRMTGQNKHAVQVNFAHIFYICNCPSYLYLRLRLFYLNTRKVCCRDYRKRATCGGVKQCKWSRVVFACFLSSWIQSNYARNIADENPVLLWLQRVRRTYANRSKLARHLNVQGGIIQDNMLQCIAWSTCIK
jgi:hypothetical protein